MRYVEGTDLAKLVAEDGALEPGARVDLALARSPRRSTPPTSRGSSTATSSPRTSSSPTPPASEHCYLGDFGLTKRTGSLSGVSVAGEIVGTLEYVAPEQITGDAVDERADVYSLGCVLYECLTGQSPFPRATDVALLWAHVHEEPTPPSQGPARAPQRARHRPRPRARQGAGPALPLGGGARRGDALGAPAGRTRRRRRATSRAAGSPVAARSRSSPLAAVARARPVTRDSGGLSSVSPNSVGVIDPASNELVAEVPVGIDPEAIAVGAGARLGRRTSRTRRSRGSIRGHARASADDRRRRLPERRHGRRRRGLGRARRARRARRASTPSRTRPRARSPRSARTRRAARRARAWRSARGAVWFVCESGDARAHRTPGRAKARTHRARGGPAHRRRARCCPRSPTSPSGSARSGSSNRAANAVVEVDPVDDPEASDRSPSGATPSAIAVGDGLALGRELRRRHGDADRDPRAAADPRPRRHSPSATARSTSPSARAASGSSNQLDRTRDAASTRRRARSSRRSSSATSRSAIAAGEGARLGDRARAGRGRRLSPTRRRRSVTCGRSRSRRAVMEVEDRHEALVARARSSLVAGSSPSRRGRRARADAEARRHARHRGAAQASRRASTCSRQRATSPCRSWSRSSRAPSSVGPTRRCGRTSSRRQRSSAKRPFTLTYHIRPEARWSDGVPVTARDFVFTHQVRRRDTARRARVASQGPAACVPSTRRRSRVVLRSRFAGWRLLFAVVLPRACARRRRTSRVSGTTGSTTRGPDGRSEAAPSSSRRWERGAADVVRNPRYWGPHTAYLDRLVFRFVPAQDPAEAVAPRRDRHDRPASACAAAAGAGAPGSWRRGQGRCVPGAAWEHLAFRVRARAVTPRSGTRLVRQAIAYGIDRAAIAREAAALDLASAAASTPLDSAVFLTTSRYYGRTGARTATDRPRRGGCSSRRAAAAAPTESTSATGERLSLRFTTTRASATRSAW